MTFFISYKYTGVDKEVLESTVLRLVNKIKECGYEVFCNLEKVEYYTKHDYTTGQIMHDCFREMTHCDYHITFVAPDSVIGEGMMIELGFAVGLFIPRLLIMPMNFKSISAKAVATDVLMYDTMDTLLASLGSVLNSITTKKIDKSEC